MLSCLRHKVDLSVCFGKKQAKLNRKELPHLEKNMASNATTTVVIAAAPTAAPRESCCNAFCNAPLEEYACNACTWSCACILSVIAIIVTSTVAMSFNYVEYHEIALLQNRYGSVDLSQVYSNQRKFLPLTQFLVTFPNTFQSLNYIAPVFTPDGLQFNLEVLFYYKLDPATLPYTYGKYSRNYDMRVKSIATTAIKNMAANYTIKDYLSSRRTIETGIGAALQRALVSDVGVAVPPHYFRIMSLTIPSTILQTSLQAAIELQNNQVQHFQQTVNLIQSETTQQVSTIHAEAARVLQFAATESNKIITEAHQFADNLLLKARGDGLRMLFDALHVSNNTAKLSFIDAFAALDAESPKILRTGSSAVILSV